MGVLEEWFLKNRRDFPWRKDKTPYRVWISEIMLQQTRASAVIPYFLRWMEKFPDVKSLYSASLEAVIKTWEGLGYYSRARNIHLAAKQIVEEFEGRIPDTLEKLLSIRGFGPYTAGAVLSFAFQKRAPAVDGNVIRVVTRYFAIEENIAKTSVLKKITEKTESLLDAQIPWVSSEALIELGATLCSPTTPHCETCPLNKSCQGFLQGKAEYLPIKTKERKITHLSRAVLVLESDGFVLVRKGTQGKIMADLYEFPYVEGSGLSQAVKEAERLCGKKVSWIKKLSPASHTFTRYKADLSPYLFQVEKFPLKEDFQWVEISHLPKLPFSSGHRKIVLEVMNEFVDTLLHENRE